MSEKYQEQILALKKVALPPGRPLQGYKVSDNHGNIFLAEKKSLRVKLGKDIQKLIRKRLSDQKTDKLRQVLAEFWDLKRWTPSWAAKSMEQLLRSQVRLEAHVAAKLILLRLLLNSMSSFTKPRTLPILPEKA